MLLAAERMIRMITCEQCGKKTGEGPVGESWICGDCKMEPEKGEDIQDDHSK